MRISTAATLALTVLLATTTLGAVAATQPAHTSTAVERSPSTSASLSPAPALEQSQSIAASSTADPPLRTPDTRQIIRIQITDDGDAVWTIESRFLVTNESEEKTFYDHANAVVSGQRTTPYGPELFEPRVSIAAESTGREMAIENAGWNEPRIEQPGDADERSVDGDDVRVGVISYSFTWTNFATVDDGRIHVGDTFQSADLFRTLDAGQRLIIEPPSDNYGFVDAPTGTENGALVWDGPHRFDPDGLEITILRGAGPGSSPLSNTGWVIAGVFALVIAAGGAYLLARRTADDGPVPTDRLPTSEWLESLGVADRLGREDASDDRGPATADGNGRLEEATATTTESPDPDSDSTESGTHLEFEESVDDDVDLELLSDEERVLRLLKQNGGRMKQASIVSETGWSNAKVSQLLSEMADDDEIEKLRIGRENLITLPGVDPTEVE